MTLEIPTIATTPMPTVEFEVQPGSEAYIKYDSKGKPKNANRRWIDVTNVGTADAENVTIRPVGEQAGFFIEVNDEPTVVHKGQTRRFGVELMMNGGAQRIVGVTWIQDGVEKSKDFYI